MRPSAGALEHLTCRNVIPAKAGHARLCVEFIFSHLGRVPPLAASGRGIQADSRGRTFLSSSHSTTSPIGRGAAICSTISVPRISTRT